ncbi:cation transporter [Arthrobacter sp. STN4]|uniref:cation transporter n=1 Tax=Arthrobacter sp. STN4 TaxID=2923276 RepID=UPI002119DF3E|nr:cation transporter [Arthrobacter sp. STN4]MCQ9165204.1 cation transporter [Arthrobacter sp. STN4]
MGLKGTVVAEGSHAVGSRNAGRDARSRTHGKPPHESPAATGPHLPAAEPAVDPASTIDGAADIVRLRRRGFVLEGVTLGWNVVGVVVLAVVSIWAGSVALAGFGLDSLIEIGASTVVVWELSGSGENRRRLALKLIAWAFLALAAYLVLQSGAALAAGHRAGPSPAGIGWTAVTAAAMFLLAAGKARTGRALGNPVLAAEGRVTFIDGLLATAVLGGVLLDDLAGWWWADPVAGLVIVYYAVREARHILRPPG